MDRNTTKEDTFKNIRIPTIDDQEMSTIQINKHSHNLPPPAYILTHKRQLLFASLIVLSIFILPDRFASGEPECGINRFNNESPLTERIVGGNNSLQ